VKVRIAFGLGADAASTDPGRFGALVDALEDLRFDSLWLSERLTGDSPDPLVGLAVAAGRTRRLKLGTSVLVLPGRNPVVLAKQFASLDRLSGGRFLPAVGLGAPLPAEQAAFGVARGDRAAWFDEALGVMRALWRGEHVTFHGTHVDVDGVTLRVHPVQDPFDVWLGGQAPSELRRIGRLGDGWLPSFTTPNDVAEGWKVITDTAAEHDRQIDPEHLGALVPYARTAVPQGAKALIARRRPDLDPAEVIPVGLPALRRHLERLTDVGASKFVLVPTEPKADPHTELSELAGAVLDLTS
jgi:probable F420-dependent oxidoreductase